MKLFGNALVLLASIMAAGASAQKRWELSPERPALGDKVHITYRPDSTLLRTGKEVKAVAYYFDTLYRWSAVDLPLKQTAKGVYEADVKQDSSWGLLAFKFRAGEITDSNADTGYIIMNAVPGRQYKGAYAGYGMLRAERYGMGIPGYYKNFQISDTAYYFWLNQEISYHRGASRALAYPFIISYANMTMPEGGPTDTLPRIQRAAAYLMSLPDQTEKEMYEIAVIAERYLKNKGKADSVRNVMRQRYPKGILTKQDAFQAFIRERDPKKSFELAEQFVKDYTPDAEMDKLADVSFDRVYRSIFANYIAKNDSTLLSRYGAKAPLSALALAYYKLVEIPYEDWKSLTAKQVYPVAATIMERVAYMKTHRPDEYWYYSPEQWAEECDRMFANDNITQAQILYETGRDKEALQLANHAQDRYQYSRAKLNELQAELFLKAGKKKELSDVLHNSVRLNQASARIFELLKKEYLSTHKNTDGFDAWLSAMKDAHTMELLVEDVKKAMIDRPAIPFTLDLMDGKPVSLSSLAGKVVILDFWATWCGPCKAAMPAMQMAQERFKNDTSVVFLFVDTQERDPDYRAKVKSFIAQKKYPFKVLFDKGEEAYAGYAKAIQTSGIPFKVVIDGKGNIRFAQVGYYGSPSALADEISTMVSLAREVK
ncbi:Thiol-disulfide isomerase or thioredoxin [Chitinophaga sp. YR627]|uniref:TlpA family protein disulfide reductase n=1 Tax=Chitinophaga sp. YR627 TaxID=1881041 RepID=UPI0008F43D3D|nr:TlpA disulfide reductase family protein [Chitinophaga sp. YR627]SFO55026.1 Thiol-disulfide isomerase or thioredoxin [Chitinophaga sp. YR627]